MPKILVVGFDGATWDILNPLIQQGKMPTFKKLVEEGTSGYMESTVPPITIPAWISMFSGLKPQQLGIFDFNRIVVEDGIMTSRLFNSSDYKGRLMWDFLSRKGMKSLVLNVPGTYPPYPIEGHLIGFDYTPMENCTYPGELEEILIEKHGWITLRETQKKLREGEEVALEILEKEDRKMLEILISLLGTHHYDVVFVRFGMPDHVSHHSRKDEEMEKCHIVMDTLLKSILDSQDYEYLFVVSDHGIRKEDTLFYLNEYLKELKYFKAPLKKRIYASFISVVSRIGGDLLAEDINRRIEWVFTRGRSVFIQEQLPYGNAAAFAFNAIPTHFCPIYMRDPAIAEEVFEKLKQSEYVREVHRIEYDYASSVRREGLEPSALVESFYSISPRPFGKSLGHGYHWFHDMKGIFLVCGKDIRKGCSSDCSIYDIAPTLLHILGLPVPDDLSGKVVTEIFEEGSELRRKSVEYMTIGECEREEEKIKESVEALRKLGKI